MTQEVFLVVYRKIHTFRHESEFSTWLFRLTRNRSVDSLRTARLRHRHVGDEELQGMPATGPSSDPEAAAAAEQRRGSALHLLHQLVEGGTVGLREPIPGALGHRVDEPFAEPHLTGRSAYGGNHSGLTDGDRARPR